MITMHMRHNTCTIMALLALSAMGLMAVSNQQFARRWNELLTIQVRNDAVRHGVDMTHVTLVFDARNHRAWITGSVGTPWEQKLLHEIVVSSQLADPDKIADEVVVRHYPEQWRRLRSHLSDTKLSQKARAHFEQLLRQYDQLIARYNDMAPSLHSQQNQVRRRLDRLVDQITAVEMELEESGVFWIDETIRQLQALRARKEAQAAKETPAAVPPAPAAVPATTTAPPLSAAASTQNVTTTETP